MTVHHAKYPETNQVVLYIVPSSHPPVPSALLDTHTHAWCFQHALNLVLSAGHREANEAAHGLMGLIQVGV